MPVPVPSAFNPVPNEERGSLSLCWRITALAYYIYAPLSVLSPIVPTHTHSASFFRTSGLLTYAYVPPRTIIYYSGIPTSLDLQPFPTTHTRTHYFAICSTHSHTLHINLNTILCLPLRLHALDTPALFTVYIRKHKDLDKDYTPDRH